ncbi:MAG: two-component system sensor histidine kinase ChvG [Moritella sp.]
MNNFNLKAQLLLVASLMLLLPWAGCQSISILEASLRESHSQLLDIKMGAAAQQIQQTIEQQVPAGYNQGSYYAPLTDSIMLLDGFDGEESDWKNISSPWFQLNSLDRVTDKSARQNPERLPTKVKFKLAANSELLYLFIQTSALSPHYFNPTQPQQAFDQLNIRAVNSEGNIARWRITPQGTGRVEMIPISAPQYQTRYAGTWRWTDGHYNIELAIPLKFAVKAIGLDLQLGNNRQTLHFKSKPSTAYERSLTIELPALNQVLGAHSQAGLNLYLLNSQHWVIGKFNSAQTIARDDESWLINTLYNKLITTDNFPHWKIPVRLGRWVDPRQLEQFSWYQDTPTNKQLHTSLMQINGERFYLVAVQDSLQSLLSASQALNKLLGFLFTIIGVIVFSLFTFASILSWRIVKMKQAYSAAIDSEGKIIAIPDASKWPDELGDLSRVMQQLTSNQRHYTDYLASLADKLSHELKTPVAVIRTSLENLELYNIEPEANKYLCRAMQGTNRLSQTLNALSEANKLEQSLEYAQWQTVPFADMLTELVEAYRQVYSGHQFQLRYSTEDEYQIFLAPELIVQLLDKLVSNAVDYSPKDKPILFILSKQVDRLVLIVENQGPKFSSDDTQRLFDSMVSIRLQSDVPHLGLGLYIVKLISDYHNAQIEANNLPGDNGVEFKLSLPIQNSG